MGRASREKRLRTKAPRLQGETSSQNSDTRGVPVRPIVVLFILSLLALLIYSNTFSVPFQFDDVYIVDNPWFKDLSHFLDLPGARYVGFLTFSLNYAVGGMKVFGYHLVNLLIHIANGFLVYSLVLLLLRAANCELRASWIAIAAALLFISHPVQTQAVTYIIQRHASLMTLFYLLTVVSYLKWRTSSKFPWYILSLLSCLLAMKTKENSFTLPLMILLVEGVFFPPFTKKRWLTLIPFLLTLPIIPFSGGDILGGAEGFARDTTQIGRLEYLFTQFRVILTYLRLLVLPINQSIDYDYPIYRSFFQPAVFLSFFFLSSFLGYALYYLFRPRHSIQNPPLRLIAFGILWFFLALSVESSIIPIRDVIFEHRLYLPSVGIFLVAGVVWWWGGQAAGGGPAAAAGESPRPVFWRVVGMGLIVLVLGGAAYRRNGVWSDDLTLWQDVVRKTPYKARGHSNLGNAYKSQGRMEEAIREYQTALRLQPDNAEIHYNLGVAYGAQGHSDEAIREYRTALQLQPDHANAHNNLGVVYKNQGRLEEAIQEYRTALQLQPDNAEAHNNLGNVYKNQGRLEEAIREYQSALRHRPDSTEAHTNLGVVYKDQGRLEEAILEYQTALRLRPDNAEAHNNLGTVYTQAGRSEEAAAHYREALRLRPDLIDAKGNTEKLKNGLKEAD